MLTIDNKKLVTAVLLVIIAMLLAVVIVGSQKKAGTSLNTLPVDGVQQGPKLAIFFYGNACPHCQDVERWMQQNQVEEKIAISKKEVYDNRENAQLLYQAAKRCDLGSSNIKVPFLLTPEGKCLVGTTEVTKYLADRISLPAEEPSADSARELEIQSTNTVEEMVKETAE